MLSAEVRQLLGASTPNLEAEGAVQTDRPPGNCDPFLGGKKTKTLKGDQPQIDPDIAIIRQVP